MITIFLSLVMLVLSPFYLLGKAIINHSNQMKNIQGEIQLGELMISKSIPISYEDITIRMANSNNLLEATEWSMMIAVWIRKGVFHQYSLEYN